MDPLLHKSRLSSTGSATEQRAAAPDTDAAKRVLFVVMNSQPSTASIWTFFPASHSAFLKSSKGPDDATAVPAKC